MKGFEKHSEDEYQLSLIDVEVIKSGDSWYVHINGKRVGVGHDDPESAFRASIPIIKKRISKLLQTISPS